MHAAFTAEQKDLRRLVKETLATLCPVGAVRESWTNREKVTDIWQGLVDLGLLGVMVSGHSGGLDLDARDAITLAVECGYAGLPGPFIDSAWAAAPLLDHGDDAAEILQALLSGRSRVVVKSPTSPLLADADLCDHVLVLDGALSRLQRPGVLYSESGIDGARRVFRMETREGGIPVSAEAAAAAFDRGALGSAAFQLGLGQRMLDLAMDYARVRQQFGRLIGSYQAVQHHLANSAVAMSFAAPLCHRAAWSLAVGHPDASIHVSMAHLRASAAAAQAGRAALQVHGAIGYTTEHDLHLFLKRVWSLQKAWGDDDFHRNRIAAALDRRTDTKEYWDV